MSLQNPLKELGVIQEALIIGLMIVLLFAVIYFDISVFLKVGIGIIAFSVIFLVTLANQVMKQAQEEKRAQN